jgi:signal transduction histidine kinase
MVSGLVDPIEPVDALGGAAVLLSAAALGWAVRYRALSREQLVEQAKLQERAQLARELHDTVAHHLSAIAIQAQAGLVLARASSPGGTTDALQIIEGEAARTLAEMRAMVAALRDGGTQAPLAGRRHLADIEGLAAAGPGSPSVDVELRGDLSDLPPAVEAALYRVAQESVTNSRRHAQLATRVAVTVIGNATDVELTVSDDGARNPGPNVPGYGLVGMTERVTLLGGTLQAGPGPDRGWCVHAVFPRPRSAT